MIRIVELSRLCPTKLFKTFTLIKRILFQNLKLKNSNIKILYLVYIKNFDMSIGSSNNTKLLKQDINGKEL